MISHASDQPGNIPTLRSKNTFVLALLSWNCFKDGAFSDVTTQVADQRLPNFRVGVQENDTRATLLVAMARLKYGVLNNLIHHTSESLFQGALHV